MNLEAWTGCDVDEEVLIQAAHWIALLDSQISQANEQTQGDNNAAFYAWLGKCPSHQQAYLELSQLWAKSACMQGMSDLIEYSKVLSFPDLSAPSHTDKRAQQTGTIDLPLLATDNTTLADSANNSVPAWAYHFCLGLIAFGMSSPILQYLF